MELIVIGVGIFVATVLILELSLLGYRHLKLRERRNVKKRLSRLQNLGGPQDLKLTRERVLSTIPWLDRLLKIIPGLTRLQRLIEQADSEHSLGYFLLLSLLCMTVAWMIGLIFFHNLVGSVLLVVASGWLPVLYLQRQRRRRIEQFQAQLPEALDLMGRALKAGHAFTSGLKLAADEFDAPLGREFQRTVDEINFGVSVADALHHLAARVDCAEARFFVVAVLLQRETGGNLTEILANLAHIIRERFKLHGKIRVLSAEGRLSGLVLIVLPLLLLAWLHISTPNYIGILFTDPVGQMAIGGTAVLMVLGAFVIKKMVTIRV
jgi:tight adherence protein B